MITFILSFYLETPVFAGMLTGAIFFGGPLGIIGWSLGYEAAMRKATSLMRERAEVDGDVPMLSQVRERRFSSVEHRGWLS